MAYTIDIRKVKSKSETISQKAIKYMPKKKTLIWFNLGLIFVAFLAFIFFIKLFSPNFYPETYSSVEYLKKGSKNVLPLQLEISSIGVTAKIIPLGLDVDGKMDNPKEAMEVGWYSPGPVPGALGSAVLAGHRGLKIGPAIFDNLDKINVGDEVKVLDENGLELVFKVREKRIYNALDKIPEVWFREDGSHLNLITCSGKQNILTGSAENRLVVFTDLVI